MIKLSLHSLRKDMPIQKDSHAHDISLTASSMMYTKVLQIPHNVHITQNKTLCRFSGPVGSIEIDLHKIDTHGLCFVHFNTNTKSPTENQLATNTLELYVKKTALGSGMIGSVASLFAQCILGVSQGFTVYLELVGVGYRAQVEGQNIEFKVGQSHELIYTVPSGIKPFLIKPTQIGLYGIHYAQVTQVAAELRNLKLPEPYKGKGIRFKDEVISTKTGKKK
jgi:large subunit ribosomal protein L6